MANVIVTVDTEVGEKAKDDPLGFEKYVLGEVGGGEYGVAKIMDVCEANGVFAEFFLDFCGYGRYGEEKFIKVSKDIIGRGHGLQLHTHPSLLRDRGRILMRDYSLKEQTEIMGEGLMKFREWCGVVPLAHRAGCYGADDNTLKALRANGVRYDLSYFRGRKACAITSSSGNEVFERDGVVEVPVSVFEDARGYSLFGIRIFSRRTRAVFDVNWLNLDELKNVLSLYEGSEAILVLFLHSCSFLNRFRDGRLNVKDPINHGLIRDFDRILKHIGESDSHRFIRISEISEKMYAVRHPDVALSTTMRLV